MSHYIAIVDPYSSGGLLAERLRDKGTQCIAIRSSREIPPVFRKPLNTDQFDDILDNDHQLEDTLQRRYGGKLTHIIAGCESGVELSDQLSENLGFPSNGTDRSRARRDKFLMSETLRGQGLRTAAVFQSHDLDRLRAWAITRDSWPVVVKPVCSVASDNIHLCESEEDIVAAAGEIIGKRNALGLVNDSVLAQEYLDGQEYVVDTVSLDGRHKITAFWAYQRSRTRPASLGYDAMTLLPYNGALQEALGRYAVAALDALGIRFGPAHCEIMWCDGEPILVELGARLSAGVNAVLSEICGCISQLNETAKAMLDPDQFHDFGNDQRILKKHASNVFLFREKPGRLKRVRHENELRQLRTLYRLSLGATRGEALPRVLGMVTLVHEDYDAIEEDIKKIRKLESDGLFEVEKD